MRPSTCSAAMLSWLTLCAGCSQDAGSMASNGGESTDVAASSGGSMFSDDGAPSSGGTTSFNGSGDTNSSLDSGGGSGSAPSGTGGALNGTTDDAPTASTTDDASTASTTDDASVANERQDASTDAGVGHLAGWNLVWSDEFDGAANSLPSASRWVAETGGGGWGNDELEYYTDRGENASLDGAGHLVITARAEQYMGSPYTSARLKTQDLFEQTYGRFEARIQIPEGQGIWPAFWMLGRDIGTASWPTCGEIDIMENIGREPGMIHGTMHGPGYSGANGVGAPYSLPSSAPFAADYHVYAIEWEAAAIRWYVDGILYATRTPADLPQGTNWVHDHPFFIILNVAVGGSWPGIPDETTMFPQQMLVDYVRVYSKE